MGLARLCRLFTSRTPKALGNLEHAGQMPAEACNRVSTVTVHVMTGLDARGTDCNRPWWRHQRRRGPPHKALPSPLRQPGHPRMPSALVQNAEGCHSATPFVVGDGYFQRTCTVCITLFLMSCWPQGLATNSQTSRLPHAGSRAALVECGIDVHCLVCQVGRSHNPMVSSQQDVKLVQSECV